MKRISIVFWLTLVLAMPVLAVHSIDFSTAEGSPFSWQLSNVGGAWQLSFVSNSTVVDSSNPPDAALLGDYVNLPTMTLSNMTVIAPGVLMATLVPAGDMMIQANTAVGGVAAGETVLTAAVGPGTFITAGTNYIAYSQIMNDLQILSFANGYGSVIPLLAADQAAGAPFDLSFSGDSTSDLYRLLTGGNLKPTAVGNLSGECATIPIIPSPGALLLTAFGTLLTGWLRRRKFA